MTLPSETFTQHPHRCKLERGHRGAREGAERNDILVVVDTLSFSTSATTAVHHGAIVYPCARTEDRNALAQRVGAEATVGRLDIPEKGRFSLSPLTYLDLEPGARIVIASPNGATCSRYAGHAPHLLETTGRDVTLLSCGERWQTPSEDDLGAGAILSFLDCDKSSEARACEGAFPHLQDDLLETLRDCGSGRELREKGFGGDVDHAAKLNLYDTVPAMYNGRLEPFRL